MCVVSGGGCVSACVRACYVHACVYPYLVITIVLG